MTERKRYIYFLGYKSLIKTSIRNSLVVIIKNTIEFEVIDAWQNAGLQFDTLGIRTKNPTTNFNLIAVYSALMKG